MGGCMLRIPLLTGCGLFDFKLKYGNAAISELREVTSFELELPLEDGGISYVDGKAYGISPNRFLCAKPGQTRRTKAPFRCYYIHLYPDDGEVCQILSELPTAIPVKKAQPYIDLFYNIMQTQDGTPHGKFAAAHSLLQLIQMLCTEVRDNALRLRPDSGRANTDAIRNAIVWIDGHLTERITLAQVASQVYLSPIYFRNLFEKTVGVSPNVYIQNCRVERAKHMLCTTDCSISEIVQQCGFSSQAYFGKVFKARIGYSPKAYRIMVNNQYP